MDIFLLRHGETEWSRDGRHTGRTDLPLTPRGEEQARLLQSVVKSLDFAVTLVSPAERARRSAELAGLEGYEVDPDLWEWDYGGYEGITTAEIRQAVPGWYIWRDGVIPGDADHPGESVEQVGLRADRAIARVIATVARSPEVESLVTLDASAALVAHGHYLRILAARWLGLPARDGRLLRLDTGTYCRLGFEHDERVILTWNCPV
jgi:probable phosphoglycerate mutase